MSSTVARWKVLGVDPSGHFLSCFYKCPLQGLKIMQRNIQLLCQSSILLSNLIYIFCRSQAHYNYTIKWATKEVQIKLALLYKVINISSYLQFYLQLLFPLAPPFYYPDSDLKTGFRRFHISSTVIPHDFLEKKL